MFIKRQLAIIVMMSMGFLALSGYFINWETLRNFTDKDAPHFYMIIAGFAAFLGCLNLLQLHLQKIVYKKENWQYSIFTLTGFLLMIFFGFIYNNTNSAIGAHLKNEESIFYWMFNYIYLPLGSTMFALLAFFVASASYRAFKIRNFEATLLLISGVLLMLGRVPVGALIPWWVVIIMYVSILFAIIASKIKNKKVFFISYLTSNIFIIGSILILSKLEQYVLNQTVGPGNHRGYSIVDMVSDNPFLSIPQIQEWIFSVPATAGARAIMIGIALGTIAQSFRIITGREKSILGD